MEELEDDMYERRRERRVKHNTQSPVWAVCSVLDLVAVLQPNHHTHRDQGSFLKHTREPLNPRAKTI